MACKKQDRIIIVTRTLIGCFGKVTASEVSSLINDTGLYGRNGGITPNEVGIVLGKYLGVSNRKVFKKYGKDFWGLNDG